MQFINEAPLYKIIRITGPRHNFLGLELSDEPTLMPPVVEALDKNPLSEGRSKFDDISAWVAKGVSTAAMQFDKNYYVRKIQFVTTDEPSASIYEFLAAEIVRRVCEL
jgi:hypothetical protein